MALFRTRARIRREAADWLARLSGEGDAESIAEFRRWYESDPRNAQAYDRMAAIWSASSQLSPDRAAGAAAQEQTGSWRRRPGLTAALSLAAGIALVFMLVVALGWLDSVGPSPPSQTVASATGEIRRFELPDGSRVVLDARSRVDIRFSASERRLILRDGRARFIVARDARPFIVAAGSSEIVATGTVFDVSIVDDRLAVVMLEGSVEVRQRPTGGDVQRLEAGQELLIRGGTPQVSRPERSGTASWPDRMLVFDETPLREAAAVARMRRMQC